MAEGEALSMQGLAGKCPDRLPNRYQEVRVPLEPGWTVNRVSHDRQADVGRVDADLVGPARVQRRHQKGETRKSLQDLEVSPRSS